MRKDSIEITDIKLGGDTYYSESYENGKITMKRATDKKIALMCPHCFNLMYGDIKREVTIDSQIHFNTYIDISDSYRFMVEICPFCNTEDVDLIELDENIAESISLLNKKGYYTNFCCGGHIIDEKFKPGYIYFNTSILLFPSSCNGNYDMLIDKLMRYQTYLDMDKITSNISVPKLWYIDKNDFKKCKFIIRQSKRNIGEKGLKNRIDSLKEWIETLPDINLDNSRR